MGGMRVSKASYLATMATDMRDRLRPEQKGAPRGTTTSVQELTPIQEHFEEANASSQCEK